MNASCRNPSPRTSTPLHPSSHRDRAQAHRLSSWCSHDNRSLHRSPGTVEPGRPRLGSAFRATGVVPHHPERPLLVYLHDPYCPWSYGYLPSVRSLLGHIGHEVDLEVVNIGLFHGESVAAAATPMEAVRRSTGARFGPGYELTLHNATMSLDSRLAAAAVIGLASAAPSRELEVLAALQEAFFWDGRSLSEPSTVRDVADRLGLDGPAVELFAGSSRAAELADEDILLANDLGARRGPMLLVSHGHQLDELEGPGTSGEQLIDEYQSVLARR